MEPAMNLTKKQPNKKHKRNKSKTEVAFTNKHRNFTMQSYFNKQTTANKIKRTIFILCLILSVVFVICFGAGLAKVNRAYTECKEDVELASKVYSIIKTPGINAYAPSRVNEDKGRKLLQFPYSGLATGDSDYTQAQTFQDRWNDKSIDAKQTALEQCKSQRDKQMVKINVFLSLFIIFGVVAVVLLLMMVCCSKRGYSNEGFGDLPLAGLAQTQQMPPYQKL
eukprot:TRINITY_DN3547_c0_g1_i1.p2 TRINITY_DN3547_c0_g1~~TRINITY_DN3547_c0_g1_i1.p2  ORF type:complete len:223 (+),score=20.05 TRINITY_DN3547_c0_g1_i1:1-669(+)